MDIPAPPPSRSRRAALWLYREALPLLLMLALLVVARSSFANHYHVPSGSMQPTLQPGDRVVVDMSAYGLRIPFTRHVLVARGTPQRGEVAVFASPEDGTRLIQRVVAVGGDRVQLLDGHLAINGQVLAADADGRTERYGSRLARLDLADGGGPDVIGATVPDGHVLVLGDHRGRSADGRYFGFVETDAIYGRAVAVYWRKGQGLSWERL